MQTALNFLAALACMGCVAAGIYLFWNWPDI